jgi:hypothetical protein
MLYIDQVRGILGQYDNDEISISKFVELLNEKALEWINADKMPNFDGDYLCHIVKKEVCGAFNKYQRVVNCSFNKWVLQEGERVTHWQKLPAPPDRTVKILTH